MSSPKGVPQLPSYLTESLIKRSLEHELGRPVTIESFTAGPATAAGDNYLSDVFWIRVLYDGGTSEKRLLAKCMPDVGDRGTVLDILDAFRKEADTFQQVLPAFTQLIHFEGTTEERFGARCYYATTDPVRTIVFEDLKALGFRMCDRTVGGLDYEHCALVMRKIGRFHAASMLYAAQNTENERLLRDRYSYGFYNPRISVEEYRIFQVFQEGLEKFIEVASGWPELESTVLDKLKALQPTFKQRLADCVNTTNPVTKVRVLNHGDLWSNNMMFRYDAAGTVLETMFVDYQLSSYGSPGIDLVYSLYNCPRFDVRRNRLDELIQLYHRSLSEVLKRGNYGSVPTLETIKEEFARHEYFGLACAVGLLPVMLMERNEDVDISFDAFFDKEKVKRLRDIQYNGALYRQSVVPMVQSLASRGYID
ncbi:Juvenile hormone-inducible protein [Anopheles darlingi]|uniref:Juvenile hormone-inducible protein n=1 Tax=Anopheles darlingi TaxID=43151 RepID=W5JRC9_ANODA|nr:Juvenile hormone-inducible protein [Anopheles darlingi]